jgi:catechol 2,3-dioxygenase-like lactoylglutathione lyase family enzyme
MKIGNITFACAEPQRLAAFWAGALGYDEGVLPDDMREALLAAGVSEDELADRAIATDPTGRGPRLLFQRVPEPKRAKNRMHLDLNTAGERRAERAEVDAEAARLRALGARVLRVSDGAWGPYPEYHVAMADPEGNEFCVQ